MSGPPAKIVCQVSGVARLPTGWLMKGFMGESGRGGCGGGGGGEEGRQRGGVGLTLLLQLQACIEPAVDSQLFCHHNKQRPHKGRPAVQSGQCGTLARQCWAPPPALKKKKPKRSISPLSLRKQSCLYWPRREERLHSSLSPSLSFLSPSLSVSFSITSLLLSPLSLSSSFLPPVFHLPFFHLLLWNKSTAVSASL